MIKAVHCVISTLETDYHDLLNAIRRKETQVKYDCDIVNQTQTAIDLTLVELQKLWALRDKLQAERRALKARRIGGRVGRV